MLEIPGVVIWDLLFGVLVTCSCDQDAGVDDQTAEILKCLFEAGDITRPEIWTEILGEVGW